MGLKNLLRERGLTQVEIATMAGVSIPTIKKMCSGQVVSMKSVEKVANYLQVSANAILGLENVGRVRLQKPDSMRGRRDYIKTFLANRDLTQKELAKLTGYTTAHINAIIAGKGNLNTRTLVRLARALKVDVNIILELEQNRFNRKVVICPNCGKKITLDD